MIWTNKLTSARQNFWHTTPACRTAKIEQAHEWCNAQESAGLFYHHYTNTRWWFEKEEDAVFFALKFSGR